VTIYRGNSKPYRPTSTVYRGKTAGLGRRAQLRRRISALTAVAAAIAIVGLGPAPGANADGVDQIVGNGDTPSAVTVSWSQGLLGLDNHTVVSKRDDDKTYAFMHPDFQNLTVHVNQTDHLVHQSVSVSWSGGVPTDPPFKGNFLEMMQCYGDEFNGPDPEGCMYGSAGMLQSGVINPGIGTREGQMCVTSTPDTTNPPDTKGGSAANFGCEPSEPVDDTHIPPEHQAGLYSVPFIPAGTTDRVYGQTTQFYDQFNTNEVQQANTGTDGTGQQSFQTLTVTQAPSLGCGLPKPGGKVRGCWLVIVPRGSFEPNGWKLNGSTFSPGYLNGSPLGAATWAQRIQIHLNFELVPTSCAIGSAKERQLVGTELIGRAVRSWQLALNAAAHCGTLYGFTATPEPTNTTELSLGGAGLAFTTIPIGSEATRHGDPPVPTPPLVYAPMTVSAITFGFYINQASGVVTKHIKLTPRLMAKALTQSYRFDLPDVDNQSPGPSWAKNNPDSIVRDPEFVHLNPGITLPPSANPLAPLITEDRSAVNMQVWAWILADPAARAWLSGEKDENGMVINQNYLLLDPKLTDRAYDSYPRADPTCFNTGAVGERDPGRCSLDLLPYMRNFDDVATHIRAGNNPLGAGWDPNKLSPHGDAGWWADGGIEPAGQVFMWGVTSSADDANLGLVPADLCNVDGTSCIDANETSVGNALAAATPDSSGLLHINPAAPGTGAYPLVTVTYAAVRAAQPPDALQDDAALLRFVAGSGQTPGVEPGQLPRGYLPLPDSLRRETGAAAAKLTTLATQEIFPTPPPQPPQVSTSTVRPPPPTLPPPGTYTTVKAVSAPERFTPSTPLGAVRWVLLGVMFVGLLGAVGSPVFRGIGRMVAVRRWRK
jgi:hypothetical protein